MYCFCTKFGQLILRKISKIVATICQILRLKCTKIQFPRPRWESLQRSQDPIAEFKGPTSKGRGGKEGQKRGGKGMKEEGRGGKRAKGGQVRRGE